MMEIEKRISRVFSHIAKTNRLEEASGKKVGDWIIIKGIPRFIVLISGSGRVDENSYFLVDEDREELSEICIEISKKNPTIVAPEDVNRYLADLIWKMKKNNWSKRGIQQEINKLIQYVRQYKGEEAIVTVPVWGLNLRGSSLVIGDVEFKPKPFTKDVEDEIKHVDPKGIGIGAIAITLSTGDKATIFENARTKINRAINILRAFAFPIAQNNRWQEIRIEGDFRSSLGFGLLNYQSHSKPGTYIRSIYNFYAGGPIPLDIERHLSLMNLLGFSELLKIINNPDKFSKRLVKAADWLGEATKPDILSAKFVKVAFAIDAMIGFDSEIIPDKGKRARIAERAAFLLGNRYKIRKSVFGKMSNIIRKRDAIAHGSSNVITTEADVEEAGKYARALIRELLLGKHKFKDVKKLDEFVEKQSFKG